MEISKMLMSRFLSHTSSHLLNSLHQLRTVFRGLRINILWTFKLSRCVHNVWTRATICIDLPSPIQCARMHPPPLSTFARSADSKQQLNMNWIPSIWCFFSGTFINPLSTQIVGSFDSKSKINLSTKFPSKALSYKQKKISHKMKYIAERNLSLNEIYRWQKPISVRNLSLLFTHIMKPIAYQQL